MRHERTDVVRLWLSRNEPPTPGPGHEGSLDPDCDPHLCSHCRRITAAPGPRGRLLLFFTHRSVSLHLKTKLAIGRLIKMYNETHKSL